MIKINAYYIHKVAPYQGHLTHRPIIRLGKLTRLIRLLLRVGLERILAILGLGAHRELSFEVGRRTFSLQILPEEELGLWGRKGTGAGKNQGSGAKQSRAARARDKDLRDGRQGRLAAAAQRPAGPGSMTA